MALLGRIHPVLVHFPIALVILAVMAEWVGAVRTDWRMRTAAVINVRVASVFAVTAAMAGWRLATTPGMDASALLEWHRWLGTAAAGVTLAAALAAPGGDGRAPLGTWMYRIVLFGAALLVAAAGHLGGMLVWGADFLRL